ncbi:WG repeat-containing protein [Rapidithrix thailandica]|uniref:WG repeat-containing protein n=1 Tax=Rapidithrix thailandica TaxID=413964 RepID=A0AAW9SJH9_9BACT
MTHQTKAYTFLLLLLTFCNGLFAQNLFPIKKEGKWGVINTKGELVVNPSYDFVSDFNTEDYAVFEQGGKKGVLNPQGQASIPASYQKIQPLKGAFIAIWQNQQCGLATQTGQVLKQPEYDAIEAIHDSGFDSYFKVYKNLKSGLINQQGGIVLNPIADQIMTGNQGLPFLFFKVNQKTGLVNTQGEQILSAEYDSILVQGTMLKAYKGKSLVYIEFDQQGKTTLHKDFTNEAAYKVFARAQSRHLQLQILKNNPDARKPRWVMDGVQYKLINGVGKDLIGKSFYNIGVDEVLGLSIGQYAESQKSPTVCFLIDHNQGKVLFAKPLEDMVISDFNSSQYARATVDTLWDALIDQQGNVVQTIQNQKIRNTGPFRKGKAWVQLMNGKYGFINGEAQVIIPFEYDQAGDYVDGFAVVRKGEKFGIIDPSGKMIVPLQYDGIGPSSEGIVRLKQGRGSTGKWGGIRVKDQKMIIPFEYQMIGEFHNGLAAIKQNNAFGVVNTEGKIVIPTKLKVDAVGPFVNGIAWVGRGRYVQESPVGASLVNFRYEGYLKKDGSFLIPPVYQRIVDFEEVWKKQQGLSKIVKNNKVGYVNYKGQIIVPAEYDQLEGFEEIWLLDKGITEAEKNGKKGYIDHNGIAALPIDYDFVSKDFLTVWQDSTGLAKVGKDKKFGYVDYSGKLIIPLLYDYISEFRQGIAIVRKGQKFGAINMENKPVLPATHDGAKFLEGKGAVMIEFFDKGEVFQLLNDQGTIQQTLTQEEAENYTKEVKALTPEIPGKYEYERTYDANGIAVVKTKGKLALLDKQGKLLSKPLYKEIGVFHEGLAYAQREDKDVKNRKFGFVDLQGNEVIEPVYNKAGHFSEGKAAVFVRGKWGYIDTKGKMVIQPQFEEALPFSGGYAIVNGRQIINEKGEKTGEFVLDGEIMTGFQANRAKVNSVGGMYHIKPDGMPAYFTKYDEVTDFQNEVAFVKRGEKWILTRQANNQTVKVPFSRIAKNQYLANYEKRRTIKTKYGDLIKDLKWTLVNNGQWRMIHPDGLFANDVIYEEVNPTSDGNFLVKINRQYGLATASGRVVTPAENETLKRVGNVIKVEKQGKLGYLKLDGSWLWELAK